MSNERVDVSRSRARRRIRELRGALSEDPPELATANSPESARSSASGLARLPFLRVDDIVKLRALGIASIEDLEDRVLQVPESAWPRVLELARTNVLDVDADSLTPPAAASDGQAPQCLALTRDGRRCRNPAREGSKYCGTHKGYQPSEAELQARGTDGATP